MGAINPEPNQIKNALSNIPKRIPIVMLNLLKFRDKAAYESEEIDISGEQAYENYAEGAFQCLQKVGGELVWSGDAKASLISPVGEEWDQVLLIRYPSIEKFLEMISSAEYNKVVKHRTAALEDSRLIATVEKNHWGGIMSP